MPGLMAPKRHRAHPVRYFTQKKGSTGRHARCYAQNGSDRHG